LNSEIRKHLPIDRIEAHSGGGDFVLFSCCVCVCVMCLVLWFFILG
jgi:hypothetical protein